MGSLSAEHIEASGADTPQPRHGRFGWLAFLGAGLSVAACYAKLIWALAVSTAGLAAFEVNPHLQAVVMWVFALVAVIGLAQDRKRHGRANPLVAGIVGLVIIVSTLYTFYDVRILVLGYICLIVAAFLNQNILLKGLYHTVQQQAQELRELNSTLEQRVQDQVTEIEQLAKLRRFLAPEVAALITGQDKEFLLDSHRRFIAALFCDLRGFTEFSERIEPEEVINVLQTYHERLGRLVAEHAGTISHRAGDGLMVVFNDPIPCDEPMRKAIALAIDMRETFSDLVPTWQKLDYQLGFGVGIASGYATLGVIGDEGRYDYTANGNVVNLASRLCDEAENGQILISQKAYVEVEGHVEVEPIEDLYVKGVNRPVKAFNVVRLLDSSISTAQQG